MAADWKNEKIPLIRKYDIPLENLSFEYVEQCNQVPQLERIIRILRSGEEGYFPALLTAAEEKLASIDPNSRVLRVEKPVLKKEIFTAEEWKEIEEELHEWEREMKVLDDGLSSEKKQFKGMEQSNVRPSTSIALKPVSEAVKPTTSCNKERIKSGDYKAWDKFNVEEELLKMDVEEESSQQILAKNRRIDEMKKKGEGDAEVKKDAYSVMEQQVLAGQAKERGNECYKAGDLHSALNFYNTSLKLFATAATYNNRALTYMKMGYYKEACADCNKVLQLEPTNVKALHRRATAYQKLPDPCLFLALQDLNKLIHIEPNNKVAQVDLQALKKKMNMDDAAKKFRLHIEEGTQLPLTYYGPSTSRFQCEPQSITHKRLSGPTGRGPIACKCNGNGMIQRQNPLCQTCGEKASRPHPPRQTINSSMEKTKNKNKIAIMDQCSVKETGNLYNHFIQTIVDNVQEQTSPAYSTDMQVAEAQEKTSPAGSSHMQVAEANEVQDQRSSACSSDTQVVEANGVQEQRSPACSTDMQEADMNNDMQVAEVNNHRSPTCSSGTQEADMSDHRSPKCSTDMQEADISDDMQVAEVNNHRSPTCSADMQEADISDDMQVAEVNKHRSPTCSANMQDDLSRKMNEMTMSNIEENEIKIKNIEENSKILPSSLSDSLLEVAVEQKHKPKEKVKKNQRNHNKPKAEVGLVADQPTNTSSNQTRTRSGRKKRSKRHQETDDRPKGVPAKINKADKYIVPVSVGPKNEVSVIAGDREQLPIKSGFEFVKSWEHLRKTDESYVLRANMLRLVRPADLPKGNMHVKVAMARVIGSKLDYEMLTEFLLCLDLHLAEAEPALCAALLHYLTLVPRCGTVAMFLNTSGKLLVSQVMNKTEGKGHMLDQATKSLLLVTP